MDDYDQPVEKRPRLFCPEEQEIIINVYKYVQRSGPENHWSPSDSESSDRTSEATGRHKSSAVAGMGRDRKSRRRPINDIVDDRSLKAIRRKIYLFFHELGHGVPTPENILREVNEDERLPNFAMPTFRRVLRHLKYRHFVTHNRYDVTSRCETYSIPVV